MVADLYPAASYEPVDYASQASPLIDPLGWVEHVVVGYGDPYWTFENAVSPNRRFSHLWVGRDGTVRQYQRLSEDSWAQGAGNGWTPGTGYWAVETEGYPTEPLTDAQIEALAQWHVWCGAADYVAATPGDRGIGTHQMGGAAWGGHQCPGPIRAGQRSAIIARAQQIRGGDVVTPADIKAIAAEVVQELTGAHATQQVHVPGSAALDPLTDAVSGEWADLALVKAEVASIKTAVAAIAAKLGVPTT